ncbi:ABC transporter ATP-binding protein [Verminephrobacter eiseniae]|uniref:ABC transporter ATP-binding protein n=1 Tax=Verminephrobacter eiseniae TaxID=364317 RepID=UPI002237AC11|nr:ABC transporter ATP-binding protein [Verminephrobacter eiseniae]MCW5236812.1 ABC transporter ATP-binding protein [Verminephrobacter eiseniae]
MAEVLLRAHQLTRRFGGLAAVNGVSVQLWRGCIHAVIGPNGAGKSTLTNLLSGEMPPTSGQVQLGGIDVTGWAPERIARQGLGRSYQKVNLFLPFTVHENIRLAAQSRAAQQPWNPLHWCADTRRDTIKNRAIGERVASVMELSGLKDRRNASAGTLSHGEQRQLEIAMTLATEPQVLLLDEPLAGMGVAEAERMVQLLQDLKPAHAIMLVEHDMDAVFALAEQITVMVNGQVIAHGTPAQVRADAAVQTAYLGQDH